MLSPIDDVVVVIPVHDPDYKYLGFLRNALDSLGSQNISPKEVLIVANHDLPYLEALAMQSPQSLNLRFLRSEARGAAENLNFAVSNSSARYTKILFQDDFLAHENSLETSLNALSSSGKKWLVIGSRDWEQASNTFFKPVIPKYTERLDRGINKIGAPSVVTFETECFVPFDNRLQYMFDCDWYLSMAHNFGEPVEIKNVGVTIRRHSGQATIWAKKLLKKEQAIVRAKHKRVKFLTPRHLGNCACTQDKR
jgi:hypothetical protein